MGLNGALYVGRSGIQASQLGLDVVGNNMANAATEGYVRRSAVQVNNASFEFTPGVQIGTGVRIDTIQRFVDEALNQRLRTATAEHHAALTRQEILSQVETIEAELSDLGLTSRFSNFFNAWSDLANNPTDAGLRSLVVQEGQALADFLNTVQSNLSTLRTQVDNDLRQSALNADDLMTRIAELNQQIVISEAGQGGGSALRDERDLLLGELAELVEIQVVPQDSGSVDVFIQSTPVVLAGKSRGLAIEFETINNQVQVRLRVTADGTALQPTTGRIGQLLVSREQDVNGAIGDLDTTVRTLMQEFNQIHASGQGTRGFDSVTAFTNVTDTAIALNTGTNLTDLPFVPRSGSFQLSVTQLSTGTRQTTLIPIDLDGLGADTTLSDLATAIDAVANISATIGVDGRLNIDADTPDFQFSFAEDTSGVLTSLGINTFFTGTNAATVGVNQVLQNDIALVAAAQDHVAGDNRNALALAGLIDQPLASLHGISIRKQWQDHVQDFAIRSGQSASDVTGTAIVAEGLETQRQSVSGVNVDEEAINLMTFQRAFQASARFITVVDELMGTLLSLV